MRRTSRARMIRSPMCPLRARWGAGGCPPPGPRPAPRLRCQRLDVAVQLGELVGDPAEALDDAALLAAERLLEVGDRRGQDGDLRLVRGVRRLELVAQRGQLVDLVAER